MLSILFSYWDFLLLLNELFSPLFNFLNFAICLVPFLFNPLLRALLPAQCHFGSRWDLLLIHSLGKAGVWIFYFYFFCYFSIHAGTCVLHLYGIFSYIYIYIYQVTGYF